VAGAVKCNSNCTVPVYFEPQSSTVEMGGVRSVSPLILFYLKSKQRR
jgi:hypothetical protein